MSRLKCGVSRLTVSLGVVEPTSIFVKGGGGEGEGGGGS